MAAVSPHVDTFLLGYSDNTRALLAHLDAEAPWRVPHVRVLEPDPLVVRAARRNGASATAVDLWDPGALRGAGLEHATTIVVFPERLGGRVDQLERVVRSVSPSVEFLVAAWRPSTPGARRPVIPTLGVIASWRFWALVTVARFFDDLAEGSHATS